MLPKVEYDTRQNLWLFRLHTVNKVQYRVSVHYTGKFQVDDCMITTPTLGTFDSFDQAKRFVYELLCAKAQEIIHELHEMQAAIAKESSLCGQPSAPEP